MNIRITDGTVFFQAGSIGSQLTRSEFLRSSLGEGSDVLAENEPYITYRFRPQNGIVASASFAGERLTDVGWQMELPLQKKREWTAESELERKKLHDSWLEDLLGRPPYTYVWGGITSCYDPKGCQSVIILRYAR
jgi:hypothetical protein